MITTESTEFTECWLSPLCAFREICGLFSAKEVSKLRIQVMEMDFREQDGFLLFLMV